MSYSTPRLNVSEVSIFHSVAYNCGVVNGWGEEDFIQQYPSDARLSHPMIVAHNTRYNLWEPGEFASIGVEDVAEVSQYRNESMIDRGRNLSLEGRRFPQLVYVDECMDVYHSFICSHSAVLVFLKFSVFLKRLCVLDREFNRCH